MDLVPETSSFDEINRWLNGFLWPEAEDVRQRRKRERILDAATALFVEYGYRKTSVDEIASRAGVAKGTVYLYYRNKAELLLHAIALEKGAYLDRLQPLFDTSMEPCDRLRALIALGLILAHEMPLVTRVSADRDMALAMQEADTSVVEKINVFQTAFMVRLLDEATGASLPREALVERAQVLVELIFALSITAPIIRGGPAPDVFAGMVADIVLDGIVHPAIGATPVPIPGLAASRVVTESDLQPQSILS